jgi:peptide-methionine (S)-S-oxide reductase
MKKLLTILTIGVLWLGFAAGAVAGTQKAIFAGGCFWCMHAEFEQQPGVTKVLSGYMGGQVKNPTYEQVSTGNTGHVEVIEVTFDPVRVGYDELLKVFWSNVDPTDPEGQFCDKGSQYLAGIFYVDETQKSAAEKSVADVEKKLNAKAATFLRPADVFYPAEDYHQSYYRKEKLRYTLYKQGCGREGRLEEVWDKKE